MTNNQIFSKLNDNYYRPINNFILQNNLTKISAKKEKVDHNYSYNCTTINTANQKDLSPGFQFIQLTKNKSYIPITGYVLEHILGTINLSYLEKLFYISADSLSIINANEGNQRGVALPSHKWAAQLGCSRAQVFKLQQSLSDKGYFIILKDKNKCGQNKRNFIIPTLPDQAFDSLVKLSDRVGGNLPYNSMHESKRAYLDRTKLFIKLNYQLLKIITSNKYLSPFHKVVWLDLFVKCYKYHILKNKERHKEASEFSLTTSYHELANRYSCNKGHLSKTMKVLEEVGFISREHFYTKKENSSQYRQDKSLWQITLSLPKNCQEDFIKLKDRSNLALVSNFVSNNLIRDNFTSENLKNTLEVNSGAGGDIEISSTQLSRVIGNLQEHRKHIDGVVGRLGSFVSSGAETIQLNEIIASVSKIETASYDPDVVDFRPLFVAACFRNESGSLSSVRTGSN